MVKGIDSSGRLITPDPLAILAKGSYLKLAGRRVWFQRAIKYMRHTTIVLFALLLFATLIETQASLAVRFGLMMAYALYFAIEATIRSRWNALFHWRRFQAIRILVGVSVLTAILIWVPGANRSLLWLGYVLWLLVACRYFGLPFITCIFVASSLSILLAKGIPSSTQGLMTVASQVIAFTMLSFLIYLLHRITEVLQVDAWIVQQVQTLTATTMQDEEVEHGTTNSAWVHALMVLAQRQEANSVSVWEPDFVERKLKNIFFLRRNHEDRQTFHMGRVREEISWSQNKNLASIINVDLGADAVCTSDATFNVHDPDGDGLARMIYREAVPTCAEIYHRIPAKNGHCLGIIAATFDAPNFRPNRQPSYPFYFTQAQESLIDLFDRKRIERELKAIYEIGVIGGRLSQGKEADFNAFLDAILNAIVTSSGFHFAAISIVDRAHNTIHMVRTTHNIAEEWREMANHALDSADIQADIVRKGGHEIVEWPDPRLDAQIVTRFEHQKMTRIFAAIEDPSLPPEQRVVGTIEAGFRDRNIWKIDADHVDLIRRIIPPTFVGIYNYQLYERERRRNRLLKELADMQDKLASLNDPDALNAEIGRSAANIFDADIVNLHRRVGTAFELVFSIKHGVPMEDTHWVQELRTGGVFTHLAERPWTPIFSNDPAQDARLSTDSSTRRRFARRFNTRACVALPLVEKDDLLGILWVNYLEPRTFDEESQAMHKLFAELAAKALRQAKRRELSQRVAARQEWARMNRELHDGVALQLWAMDAGMRNLRHDIAHMPQDVVPFSIFAEMDRVQLMVRQSRQQLRDFLANARVNRDGEPVLSEPAAVTVDQKLRQEIDGLRKQFEIGCELKVDDHAKGLLHPSKVIHVIDVVREAIVNAVKHGSCKGVTINLSVKPDHLMLTVWNDGREGPSFDMNAMPQTSGQGLYQMRESALALGGQLSGSSEGEGNGYTVRLIIPLEHPLQPSLFKDAPHE